MGFRYLSWSGRDDLVKGGMFLVSLGQFLTELDSAFLDLSLY